MTEAEKKMKKYTRAVNRKLNLPSDVKKRVMTDFTSSIQSRKEAGKTDEEIYAELGTPADVAADLNEQMKEFAYIKSPWRWVCFALIIVCSMTLLYKGGAGMLAAMLSFALFNESVGIIGGVDGPTQIFIAQSQDSMIQGMVMTALVLVMSILGFYFLGHMRKKETNSSNKQEHTMRRFFAITLCIILVVSFAACSAERPSNIKTENSSGTLPESITFNDDGVWPDDEYTQDIPTPPGTIGWVMLDSEKENCSIQIDGMTKAQFDSYYEKLLDSGYIEIEKVEEEVKGQGYISIGTIISNGSKSVSLAYAESVLMMTIVNRGVNGSELGFLQSSNLTNVYVNAYSTYDAEDGVQVVTELYVPEGEKPIPQFSMVNGMVTITVGDNTSSFFLGTAAKTEAVGLAVNSKMLGSSGEKGFVVIAGTAYADNAVVGCGSFGISYEITIP